VKLACSEAGERLLESLLALGPHVGGFVQPAPDGEVRAAITTQSGVQCRFERDSLAVESGLRRVLSPWRENNER
jgi:hypothetical protein